MRAANDIETATGDSLALDSVENYADMGDAEEATIRDIEGRLSRDLTEDEEYEIAQLVEIWWNANEGDDGQENDEQFDDEDE